MALIQFGSRVCFGGDTGIGIRAADDEPGDYLNASTEKAPNGGTCTEVTENYVGQYISGA